MSSLPEGLELRVIRPEEFEAWGRQVARQFGDDVQAEDLEYYREKRGSDIQRTFAITDAGRIVATGVNFSFTMTVPGGAALGCAGVSGIGVQTTHRRRGLLRALMRTLLDDAVGRGEPLAALLASESSIYGRFGFGPAIPTADTELAKQYARFVEPVPARVELLDAEEAIKRLPAIYARVLPTQPGLIAHPDWWWPVGIRSEPSHHREGASSNYFAAVDDRGYVRYRIKTDWDQTGSTSMLRVEELIAADPETAAALWQYCFDVDLIAKIEAYRRPLDDPLAFRLVEPARLKQVASEPIWVRLIDVPAALEARTYPVDGLLAIRVHDTYLPHNDGTWLLECRDGRAHCEQTGQVPDLEMDVGDLATGYLGGVRYSTLTRAGRISERRPGVAAQADLMFAADPLPWQPWGF